MDIDYLETMMNRADNAEFRNDSEFRYWLVMALWNIVKQLHQIAQRPV